MRDDLRNCPQCLKLLHSQLFRRNLGTQCRWSSKIVKVIYNISEVFRVQYGSIFSGRLLSADGGFLGRAEGGHTVLNCIPSKIGNKKLFDKLRYY